MDRSPGYRMARGREDKDVLASTWLFQLLNCASLILSFVAMVSHWSPDETL